MMIRAIVALGGTAAGLAALLSFKTHPATEAAPAPMTPSPSGSAASAPMNGAAAGKSGMSKSGMAKGGSTAATAARTLTGSAVSTQYGPMQVAVTMTGKKITGVKILQHTDDGAESMQIDSGALPKLTSETLAAQSAQIDAVSGASYTSSGYKQSLQSALDKAM